MRMPALLALLSIASFSSCGGATAPDLAGRFIGSPKLTRTIDNKAMDIPVSGNALTLTAEGTGTLTSDWYSSACILKFTNGADPMKFALTPISCSETGTTTDFKSGSIYFSDTNNVAFEANGELTLTASDGSQSKGTLTMTFAGKRE